LVPGSEEDEEGEEEPKKLQANLWKKLLDFDEDGVFSLKPWREVSALKANKVNLALALREVMRQAWGEYFFIPLFSLSNLRVEQSGRRGKIPWGKIVTDPEDLIDPKFQLDTSLTNPTRMTLETITAYWKDWVSRDKEGDPFSFLSAEGDVEDKDINHGGDSRGETSKNPHPDHFSVDDDIPLPLECETPEERTSCLQRLVPNEGQTNKMFHKLVKKVDTLEVSYMVCILSSLYLIQF